MECGKIFESVRSRMVRASSFNFYKKRIQTEGTPLWDCFGDGFGGTQGGLNQNFNGKHGETTCLTSIGDIQTTKQEVLGGMGVEVCKNVLPSPLQEGGRGVGGSSDKSLNEFRSLLSSTIITNEISWKDCEKNEKFQRSFYNFLGNGLLVIKDIPKIPDEFETKGAISYYGLDTEDDSLGTPHFYQFASRDEVIISMSFRLLMRYLAQEYQLTNRNHIIWGTNIEYELGNIIKDWDLATEFLDVRWTKGGLRKFELMYVPDKLNWSGEEDRRCNFKVWDTMNHWPISVKKMGVELSNLLNFEFNKLDSDFYSLQYAAMDAILSRSYACVQKKYYDSKGIDLKLTTGSTSLNFYMQGITESGQRLCRQKIYNTHAEDELRWMVEGYRGGRTEVFSLAEHHDTVGYYDINSAYPYAMKFGEFPYLKTHYWYYTHETIQQKIDGNFEGMALCDVDATNVDDFTKQIPYLCTKDMTTQRLIFPLGTWKGKYTFFEIRQAMKLGYKFHFKEAIVYPRSKHQPFADFVDLCYAIRDEGTRTKNPMLRNIGKNLGNNLYGKFAQKLVSTNLVNPDDYEAEDFSNMIRLGKAVMLEQDDGFAIHTNVIWSAYITSICRDVLFKHMVNSAVNGNEILYCDTDSIFIKGGKPPETHQTNLGALKLEDHFSYFRAYLPKTYVYEVDGSRTYKAKGVPKEQRERFMIESYVEYRKPMKIREAMRRTDFGEKNKDLKIGKKVQAVNAWVTVSKQLKGNYTKRIVLPDGSTKPIYLKD